MSTAYECRKRDPWRPWTEAEKARLRELHKARRYVRVIAKELGRTPNGVNHMRRALGLTARRDRPRTAAEAAETRRLILAGEKYTAIAAKFGRTRQSVGTFAEREGLTVPPETEHRRRLLVALFRKHKNATAVQLARLLGVHPATVREDFKALGMAGEYQRRYLGVKKRRNLSGVMSRERDGSQRVNSTYLGYPPVLKAYRRYFDVVFERGEVTAFDVAPAVGVVRVCVVVALSKLHKAGHLKRVGRRVLAGGRGGWTWVYALSDAAAADRRRFLMRGDLS